MSSPTPITASSRSRRLLTVVLMMGALMMGAFLMTMKAAALAQVEPLGPGGTFQDDNGSIHEADIEALAAAGITRGCNPPVNDAFCPTRPVLRGEMAAFLARALETQPSSIDAFDDDDTSIFETDIDSLAAVDVIRGCGTRLFCPYDAITRGEMAALLARGYDLTRLDGSERFQDVAESIFSGDIGAIAETGITLGCTPPDNDLFCPDEAVTREQMASFLVRAEGLTTIPVPEPVTIGFEPFVDGLENPVHVSAPSGDDRVFIVEKPGRIQVVIDGVLSQRPFLDITSKVDDTGGEMGLLSMAFHPGYAENGRFFVAYSGPLRPGGSGDHTEYLSEFVVSADPNVAGTTERVVLAIDQPASNHNGGHVLFGPDGYLYLALGDGGGAGDPFENGQDNTTLLGSILRIDVDGADPYQSPPDNPYVGLPGADEIWAIGLRNPWRIWFDDGLLYVADVGQSEREEVSVVADSEPGLNFGWDVLEGTTCYEPSSGCSTAGFVLPVIELSHSDGACSITGGVVYRGSELPQLHGRYMFTDLCTGVVETIQGSSVVERRVVSEIGLRPGIWSFGVDGHGEMYAALGGSGSVWKFVPN